MAKKKEIEESNMPAQIFVIEFRYRACRNSKWGPWYVEFGNRYYYPSAPSGAEVHETKYERRARLFVLREGQ